MFLIWLLSLIGSSAAAFAYYAAEPIHFVIGAFALAFVFGAFGSNAKERGAQQLLQWMYRFSLALMPFGVAAIIWQDATFPEWLGDAVIIGGLSLHVVQVTLMFLRRQHDAAFSVLAGIMSLPILGPVIGPLAWAF